MGTLALGSHCWKPKRPKQSGRETGQHHLVMAGYHLKCETVTQGGMQQSTFTNKSYYTYAEYFHLIPLYKYWNLSHYIIFVIFGFWLLHKYETILDKLI